MEWTTEQPVVDGLYWVLDDGEVDLVRISWDESLKRWCAYTTGDYEIMEPKHFTHFMGPLEKPEPPQP